MKRVKLKSITHEVLLLQLIDINHHSLIYPKATSWGNYLNKPIINYINEQLIEIENEVNTNPNHVFHINIHKETALHLLVAQPVPSLQLTKLLIKLYPDACKLKNIYGNLPIHLLCLRGNPCDISILKLLVDIYPESLSIQSNLSSQLPANILTMHKKVEAFDILYMYNSKSVHIQWEIKWNVLKNNGKYDKSNTPLHIIIYENALPQEIYYLIEQYPQYLFHKNCIKRIPLDTAACHYYQYTSTIRSEVITFISQAMKWYPFISQGIKWHRRKNMILIALRLYNGKYFEIFKYIALYL